MITDVSWGYLFCFLISVDLELNLRTSLLFRAQILFGIVGPGMESQKTTISFGGQTTD